MTGGKVCSVAVCKNNSKKAKESGEMLMFFSFPKDPLIKKEWIRKCHRKDKFFVKYKRVCSKHFTIEDYEDAMKAKLMGTYPKKLKKTAIPSLYLLSGLENVAPKITERTKRIQEKEKKEMMEKLILSRSHLDKPHTITSAEMENVPANVVTEYEVLRDISTSHNKLVEDNLKQELQKLQEENELLKTKIQTMEVNETILKQKLCEVEKLLKEAGCRNYFLQQLKKKNMDTEPDPLAITPDYNLAVFGGADNIEFIVESDEDNDQDSDELETKDGIVIEIDDLEELNVEEIMARNRSSNSPRESLTEYQLIDLDEPEVKEEIEEVVDIATPNDEKECEPAVSEKLVNINQDRMKNSSCYVPGCTSEFSTFNEEKICWFTVPTDENLKKIWNICIGRVDKPLTHGDVICHKHFSEFTVPYDKPKLTRGAVPCIKFHEECCVPTCRRTIGRMYCFPVLRTSDFHLWMYMVKNPILKHLKMKEVLRHRVCDIHFDSDCFDDDFLLKKSAAPTLYVPGNYTVDLASIKSDSERAATISQNDILICAHGECPNRSNSGKKIFRFPTVASRCNAWLKACGRRNLISSPQITLRQMRRLKLGVCEDHFNFQDFKDDMQELKPDVIPKPYRELGLDFRKSKAFSTETVGKNVIPGISSALKSFGGICAYNGCQSKPSAANPFFRFPSDTERAEKWLRACGILKRKQSLTSMLICIKHFDKDMFDAFNRLKDDAIPISYNLHKQMEDEKMSTAMNNSTLAITEQQQISLHSPTAIEANTQNGKEEHCIESKPKSIIRCAVENCQHFFNAKYIRVNNHRFPDPIKDPQRFNIWLQLIANPKLKDLSKEEIYNNYLVCVRHFETYFYRQFGKGTQLSQEAIPTKNLPVDHQWFYTSEYYKTRLKSCFGNFGAKDSSEDVTMEWKEEDIQDIGECEDKTRCILEKDRIRFPGMGNYLYMGQRVNKNKVPYNVYNCLNSGYGLSRNVEIGENIRIHTAIIIDDDDDLERQVLQDLLDKRRKKS